MQEAFRAGRLSYSKVRAVARVATPDNEADLLDAALHAPAAQVERLTRGLRRAERHADDDEQPGTAGSASVAQRRSGVQWRWDDDGDLVIWGRLGAEEGERLLAGLTRTAALHDAEPVQDDGEGSRQDAEGCSAEPPRANPDLVASPPPDLAEPLVAMADLTRSTVDAPTFAPAAEVWVHADADDVAQAVSACSSAEETRARFDDGPPLTVRLLSRLACDGGIRLVTHSRTGATLDVGRKRRRPTSRQLMTLWHRDRGCIVPGCGATRFLHAHHVVPWARGGRTSVDNLVLLCGEHHRALHDGAIDVVARGDQRFDVTGAGGDVRPPAPSVWGNVDDLAARSTHVTSESMTPDWDGSALDLAHAVDVYLQRWQVAKGRRQLAQPLT